MEIMTLIFSAVGCITGLLTAVVSLGLLINKKKIEKIVQRNQEIDKKLNALRAEITQIEEDVMSANSRSEQKMLEREKFNVLNQINELEQLKK